MDQKVNVSFVQITLISTFEKYNNSNCAILPRKGNQSVIAEHNAVYCLLVRTLH